MEIKEFYLWEFEPELDTGSFIECPGCGEWSCHTEWEKGLVGCDCCGDHDAIVCPECLEYFDHVCGLVFKTKKESAK